MLNPQRLIGLLSRRVALAAGALAVAAGGSAAVVMVSPSASHGGVQVGSPASATTLATSTTSADGDQATTIEATTETAETSEQSTDSRSESTDRDAHGDAVEKAVESCKAALGQGEHGIGPCVSVVAASNGEAHRHTSEPTPRH